MFTDQSIGTPCRTESNARTPCIGKSCETALFCEWQQLIYYNWLDWRSFELYAVYYHIGFSGGRTYQTHQIRNYTFLSGQTVLDTLDQKLYSSQGADRTGATRSETIQFSGGRKYQTHQIRNYTVLRGQTVLDPLDQKLYSSQGADRTGSTRSETIKFSGGRPYWIHQIRNYKVLRGQTVLDPLDQTL